MARCRKEFKTNHLCKLTRSAILKTIVNQMPNIGPPISRIRGLRPALIVLSCCLSGVGGCKSGRVRSNGQPTAKTAVLADPSNQGSDPFIEMVGFEDADPEKNDASVREPSDDRVSTQADHTATAQSVELLIPETRSQLNPDQLESLIATALGTHPRIAAARQTVAAAAMRIPQARALPDPMFGNTFWPIHDQALQTAGGRVGHQFALSQNIPWPTKLDARACVAAREVQVARAEIAKVEREIVEAVHLAYYELWLADELIRIVDDNKELAADLVTIAEARYQTGGSQQDVLRAQIEADKLEEQLINLRRQKEQARADLGTLVRQPMHLMPVALTELDVSEAAPELELLVARAEQCNPTLQGLAAEIARDRAKESLACLQKYPDLQLGLGYSIINDDTSVISPVANGHDNINFSFGVTLPIWRDKINAGIREAAHTRTSTMNRNEAERDKLRGQLRRQVAASYAAIERLNLFRDRLIPRTEQTLTIATADYQGKKADFTDLIDIFQELLAFQVQVAHTKATLASTLAQIDRTVGCSAPSLEFTN